MEKILPEIKPKLSEVAIDGRTIRLRGEKEKRIEILDWFHLMENLLHKVEGSKNQIEQAKSYLWTGKVEETIQYLKQQKMGCSQSIRV